MATNAVIGALRVDLGINSAAFTTGLKKAEGGLKQFSSQMKVVAGALAALGAGIGLAIRGVVNEADALAKVSDKIGFTVESLSALGHAAELSGVSVNTLHMALQRFSRRTAEAVQGSGELQGILKQYNIAVTDASGTTRNQIDILRDLAEVIKNAGTEQERLRIAFKAFDSEGAALVNMLKDGAAGLDAMIAEAEALGLVIDTKTARAAERFNDNLTRLQRTFTGITRQVAANLTPALERLSAWMVSLSMSFRNLSAETQQWLSGIAVATVSVTALTAAFVALRPVLAAMAGLFAAAVSPIGLAVTTIAALTAATITYRDTIERAVGVDVVGVWKRAMTAKINAGRAAVEAIAMYFSRALVPSLAHSGRLAANAFIAGIEAIVTGTVRVLNAVIDKINAFVDRFGGDALREALGWDLAIGRLGEDFELPRLDTTASRARLESELKGIAARFREIMQSDLLGEFSSVFTQFSGDSESVMAAFEKRINDAMNRASESVSKAAGKVRDAIDPLDAEARRIYEATRTPFERLQQQLELLSTLLEKGKIDFETYTRAVQQAQAEFDAATARISTNAERIETGIGAVQAAGEELGHSLGSALEGIVTGSVKAKDAVANLLKELARVGMNKAFGQLFGLAGGALGGLFGSGGSGGGIAVSAPASLGSISIPSIAGGGLKFGNGGSFKVGGAGGTDSQVVAFRATPGEMVDVRTPGQQMRDGGINFAPVINAPGADAAQLRRVEAKLEAMHRDLPNIIEGKTIDARRRLGTMERTFR